MAIETMTATVAVKAQAQTQKGDPYWKMDLLQDGAERAQTWTMFGHDVPFEKGTPINVGERWEFGVEERPKDGGGTWRNIKGIVRKVDAATPQSVAKAKAAPAEATERDQMIARQVALKAAVEYAGYRIQAGKEVGSADTLKVATAFAGWLGAGTPHETAPDGQNAPSEPASEDEAIVVENERMYG